jgi:hypothetical protein
MIKGSCLCGGVQLEADRIPLIVNCHCSMFRKHHGTAFGTLASVRIQEFQWLEITDGFQSFERLDRDRGKPTHLVRSPREFTDAASSGVAMDPPMTPIRRSPRFSAGVDRSTGAKLASVHPVQ